MKIPIVLEFKNLKVLVVGSGKVGIRRANKLKDFGADVIVIDKEKNRPDFLNSEIIFEKKSFQKEILNDFDMILAATNNKELNKKIVEEANNLRKLSASVDIDSEIKLSFPAIYQDDNLLVSFYSGSPKLSKSLRDAYGLQRDLGKESKLLKEVRNKVIKSFPLFKDQLLNEILLMNDKELNFLKKIPKKIRVGTRGSKLARTQTEIIIKKLKEKFPYLDFEEVIIVTLGDKDQKTALSELKSKEIFTTEIEKALLDKKIDFAVHSLKDLSAQSKDNFTIITKPPEREETTEVIITKKDTTNLKIIGTGSERRKLQLLELYPDSEIKSIRGNVNTRLEKLKDGLYDGIVLAKAGLNRLGITKNVLEKNNLKMEELPILPALRQGMLGIETLKNRDEIISLLESIGDDRSQKEFLFETNLLNKINGDCTTIIGGRFNHYNDLESFEVFFLDKNQNPVFLETIRMRDLAGQLEISNQLAQIIKEQMES